MGFNFLSFLQSPQFQPPTAQDCTVSSLTNRNATSSGTAGMVKLLAISAAPDSLTTEKLVCACGLTRSLSVGTKVNRHFQICTKFIAFFFITMLLNIFVIILIFLLIMCFDFH